MKFVDGEAQKAFDQAIVAIEVASSAEVVVAVRARSERYSHVHAAVAAIGVFGMLAYTLYAEQVFSLLWILVLPLATGVAGALLVEAVPAIRRIGTSQRQREQATRRAARATFVELSVHHTAGRTGMLFYFSVLERSCVVVGDQAVGAVVPTADLAALEAQLSAAMADGGTACARAMDRVVPLLKALPCAADDRNELPDAMDVAVGRSAFRARLFGGRV